MNDKLFSSSNLNIIWSFFELRILKIKSIDFLFHLIQLNFDFALLKIVIHS